MDVTSSNLICIAQTDHSPLLMERIEMHHDHEHIIDMTRNNDASSSSSSHGDLHPELDFSQHDDGRPSSVGTPTHPTSSTLTSRLNSRNSTFSRRGDSYGRRRRSPLNSGLWISVELLVTVCQIVASVVVLLLSRNEHPKAPLFAWVVGYASGCVATLPILYWRFRTRNEGVLQDPLQSRDGALQTNLPDSAPYTAISINQEETMETPTRADQQTGNLNERISSVMDHLKMGLDCFFAVWFVVGNVWIFGGHASPDDAPKLYKLCIVFLTFSCIGYAMPFILCATICCCLPCIISLLGFREEYAQTRGASVECINSLPTYKFKLKNKDSFRDHHDDSEMGEGGILAAGTAKERMISGEDAVCCICLNEYEDEEELKELPCGHVFHVECVDKWLKINASCPLCKYEICESGAEQDVSSPPIPATIQH
ncbi:E3 ubiquitin-protein ligase At4g11680 [Linum perenne]